MAQKNNGKNYYGLFLNNFDSIIHAYLKEIDDFLFVQIGANDGIMADPINKFIKKNKKIKKGLLVEPQKKEFNRLKRNYKNKKGFIFENVAISNKNEIRGLYKVKDEKICADWQRGIATLIPNKGCVGKMKKKDLVIEKVKCITFDKLIKKHKIKKIDLLQIDVEGYDYEIIKSINFSKIKPKMINYENDHLKDTEKESCIQLLQEKGYIVITYGTDTIALLNNLFKINSLIVESVNLKIKE